MKHRSSLSFRDYGAGHCWYYLLGGVVRTPRQIKEATRRSGYKGCSAGAIAAADRKVEPQRSASLRTLRAKFEADLKQDVARYRQCALWLHRYRAKHPVPDKPECAAGVHVAISLKHNHIVNGFAHIITIDELLNRQGDLFG